MGKLIFAQEQFICLANFVSSQPVCCDWSNDCGAKFTNLQSYMIHLRKDHGVYSRMLYWLLSRYKTPLKLEQFMCHDKTCACGVPLITTCFRVFLEHWEQHEHAQFDERGARDSCEAELEFLLSEGAFDALQSA